MGSELLCKDFLEVSLCVLCKGKYGFVMCKNFLVILFKEWLEICMLRGICFFCFS